MEKEENQKLIKRKINFYKKDFVFLKEKKRKRKEKEKKKKKEKLILIIFFL